LISSPPSTNASPTSAYSPNLATTADSSSLQSPALARLVFGGAVFLVAVPVFFEAPLVRVLPWLSLALTLGWVWLSVWLSSRAKTQIWGELLTGFTWTWLAGSLYWGWLRWEPLWHLPIEAIALPIAIWGLANNWCKIGNCFYLGSLLGTVVTDCYFYLVDLIPYWRKVMVALPEDVQPIFRQAIAQVHTSWGLAWVAGLACLLLGIGIFALRSQKLAWIAFGGAVLSTILVDGLFWLAASLA
jgi:Protein of unknown function (DUF3120)